MSTLWTVCEWADTFKERLETEARRPNPVMNSVTWYKHVFGTEQEAKDFIRYRAYAAQRKLEKQLKLARKRIMKLDKKFGPTSIEQVNELFKRFEAKLAGTDV